MKNVKDPESSRPGAVGLVQAHAAASIYHVNIARFAVFANDRHESDWSGVERIAQVTRQTAAMPVKVPCTDESRAFSTREARGCRAGRNEMTVLRSARACTTDASALMKQGG